MKKMFELKDYDTFVRELNENRSQKKSAVENAVNKIKEKYGDEYLFFNISGEKFKIGFNPSVGLSYTNERIIKADADRVKLTDLAEIKYQGHSDAWKN